MSTFVIRGPLAPGDHLFKGRKKEINQLARLCEGDVTAYAIVYGGRQTGKTSLLNQLENHLKVSTLRIDFQMCPGCNSSQAFNYIAKRISSTLGKIEDIEIADGPNFIDYLCQTLEKSNLPKFVLLMEELGALPEEAREDLANLFRAIFTNRYDTSCSSLGNLMVIIAGNIELYNLVSKDVSPLANICERLYLPDLDETDSIDLIHDGLMSLGLSSNQSLSFAKDIYQRVNGHPYLTQRFGWYIEQSKINQEGLTLVIEKAAQAILNDDTLIDHVNRNIRELDLFAPLQNLLRSNVKFSRTDEEMVKLEILGVAKELNGQWKIRNPLLQEAVTKLSRKKNNSMISKQKRTEYISARIFVSSTWIDLQPEREAVEKILHRMKDTNFKGMEYFGSQDDTPLKVSLQEVDNSDLYIGIFAHRYGSGITEKEYRRAQKKGIPCLIYFKDDETPVLPTYIENDQTAKTKLETLKKILRKNHIISTFKTPDELSSKVTADLHNLLKV